MNSPTNGIRDDSAQHRFVLETDEGVAELVYRLEDDRLVLIHTEVPDAFQGRGIGAQLVTTAVDRARADGLTIVPLCPYARQWLERHPDATREIQIDWGGGAA